MSSAVAPPPLANRKPRFTARNTILVTLAILLCSSFLLFSLFHRTSTDQQETDPTKELNLLQGTWRMVYGESGGERLDQANAMQRLLTHTGNDYVMKVGTDIWSEGTFKVDVAKRPMRMRSVTTKGKAEQTIYILADDLLVMCASYSKADYPETFTAQKGYWLAVYKRERSEGNQAGAAQSETDLAKELKSLQGTWRMAYGESGGEPLSQETANQRLITHTGNNYVMKVGTEVFSEGTFELDVSKPRKRREVTATGGQNKGKVEQSIYFLAGDIFVVCGSYSKPAYPERFTGKDGFYLGIYKRERH